MKSKLFKYLVIFDFELNDLKDTLSSLPENFKFKLFEFHVECDRDTF